MGLFSSFMIFFKKGEQQSFAPSSSPTRHFGYTWCDQRTPSVRLNKMAWSTRFPASAAKSTSEKQGDIYRRGSKSTTGIYDSPVPRPPPFLNRPTRPANIQFGTRRLHPNIINRDSAIEIPEAWMPMIKKFRTVQQRTAEVTTNRRNNGGSKSTNYSRPSRYN